MPGPLHPGEARNHAIRVLGRLVAACITVSGLMAAEYHGTVKAGGLAFRGATVTAIQGDQQIITTTDRQGMFDFSESADGTWMIEVEVLGFEKIARNVGVASDAPSVDFVLKFLTVEVLAAGQGRQRPAIPVTEALDLTPSSANSFTEPQNATTEVRCSAVVANWMGTSHVSR